MAGLDFERRAARMSMTLGFLNDLYHRVADWSEWASGAVASADHGRSEAIQVFTEAAARRRSYRKVSGAGPPLEVSIRSRSPTERTRRCSYE